jgi:hypothetical protein
MNRKKENELRQKMTSEIINKILFWLQDKLEYSDLPSNVVALNFRIQKVFDGYEIFQEGCDDFNEYHETWFLSNIYEPHDNFFSLGQLSLNLTETEIFDLYKSQVENLILQKERLFAGHLKFITITYFNGQPEIMKKH